MKKARMNISHFRFILFNLKIFGEIVTNFLNSTVWSTGQRGGWLYATAKYYHLYAF